MKSLFWQIFNCKSADELDTLVKTNSFLSNDDNWLPYGGKNKDDRSNFGIFENQQPHPIPALVEKITNSIDSLLLKECRIAGINPKSNNAPKNMAEAVETFFEIKNGDFSEIGESNRREIAENIQIVVTDDRETPNILVYDNGEGQHPNDFPKTFLSLLRNNKTEIPFVQGKYNQGATGAVVFCGPKDKRYQLIASKLNDKLNTNPNNEFGFTLVRRHPLNIEQEENYRSTWYEYFQINECIPRFNIDTIDLGLFKRHFQYGSIIKLYSYQLPTGSKSNATLDLWRDLNQYLYQPALPILIYEKRFSGSHNDSKLVLGNKTRIIIDDRDKKETTVTININNIEDIGKITIEATVFKQDVKQREFIKDKAVIFTINGQTQGSLPRAFISQKLGLSLIRDYVLIQIDCTNMRVSFRQDLFMANRHNLKEGADYEKLIDLIVQKIKEDGRLKELDTKRKDQIFKDTKEDKEILRNLASKFPITDELKNLLMKNGNINFLKTINKNGENEKNKNTNEKVMKPFESHRFPSIFKIQLKDNDEGKKIKTIPLNGKGFIKFETDVEEEYFFRPKDKGELNIAILQHKRSGNGGDKPGLPRSIQDIIEVTQSSPNNGLIKVILEPNKNFVNVGDEIEIKASLTSPSGNFESLFYVKIIDPQNHQEKPQKEKVQEQNLPEAIKVYEKNSEGESHPVWADFTWDGNDIIKIIPTNQNEKTELIEKIAINMDSFVLKKYMAKNKYKNVSDFETMRNKYFAMVYFHSIFLYSILVKQKKEIENFNKEEIDLEEFIANIFKYYTNVLLYSTELDINDDE